MGIGSRAQYAEVPLSASNVLSNGRINVSPVS